MAEENEKKVKDFLSGLSDSSSGKKTAQKRHVKRYEMETIDKVLPGVLTQLGLERRLREHTLMQLWPTLVPVSLAERSRPVFIDHQHNLVIAVSDASVAQELSLMKGKIMQSLGLTARSLGLEIKALRIDMKNFHRSPEPPLPEESPMPKLNEHELVELELSQHDKQLIVDLSKKLAAEGQDKHMSLRVLHAYETQLRLTEWRRRKGFPLCSSCGNPVARLFEHGSHKVCFNCKVADQLQA